MSTRQHEEMKKRRKEKDPSEAVISVGENTGKEQMQLGSVILRAKCGCHELKRDIQAVGSCGEAMKMSGRI